MDEGQVDDRNRSEGTIKWGKTSISGRSEKNIREKIRRRFTVALERTKHLKLHVPSKTYSSDYNSTSNYMHIPPRTGLEP